MNDIAQAWLDFDIRNDPEFENIIKPFIENQLKELELYDRQRLARNPDIQYIFHKHAYDVSDDVRKTAAHLGQPEHVQEALYWAMLAHDIGKRMVPVEAWDKPGKPTPEEKALTRQHPDLGLALLDDHLGDLDHPFVDLMRDVIKYHHAHMDGSGTPPGITGDMLSKPVRLCAIVEAFDGYTKPRPDRPTPRSAAEALDKMHHDPDKGAKMYDMELLAAFTSVKLGTPSGNAPPPHKPASKAVSVGSV
jgi:HD-GYP domain-containing protein (c-di-GMP phosphodiesterase class II)